MTGGAKFLSPFVFAVRMSATKEELIEFVCGRIAASKRHGRFCLKIFPNSGKIQSTFCRDSRQPVE
jgi:hypothetical protein